MIDNAFGKDVSVNEVALLSQAEVLVKLATGRLFIVIRAVSDFVQPFVLIIFRITIKVPAAVKACVGFCKVEILFAPESGSPKFHVQF